MENPTHVPGLDEMEPLAVVIGGVPGTAAPKVFSTGSRGWHHNAKGSVQGWDVQVSLTLTIIGSKGRQAGEPLLTPEERASGRPTSDFTLENGVPPARRARKRS